MVSPADLPVLRVKFKLADGTVLGREWTMQNATEKAAERVRENLSAGPPSWLLGPLKSWDHPQDPVTFSGTVAAGHEDEAYDFLGLDRVS